MILTKVLFKMMVSDLTNSLQKPSEFFFIGPCQLLYQNGVTSVLELVLLVFMIHIL